MAPRAVKIDTDLAGKRAAVPILLLLGLAILKSAANFSADFWNLFPPFARSRRFLR